jgi:hypothetical protein
MGVNESLCVFFTCIFFVVEIRSKTPLNTCEVRGNSLNEMYMLRNGFSRLRSYVHLYWNAVFHGILP